MPRVFVFFEQNSTELNYFKNLVLSFLNFDRNEYMPFKWFECLFLRFGTKQIVASVTYICKPRTSFRRRATLNGGTEKYNGMAL